ncbi:hypothetical protein LCGC14_0686530 [marine sediment metagenome]|uniref:Uncharacterized protein n=1 Tax=marine sediment metagenome TaxID=412755 RepID=A0A0F9T7V8_9ZZZZ
MPGKTRKPLRIKKVRTTRTGWMKSLPAKTRRARVLRSHKGDLLAAARSLQVLANVTLDPATRRLAGQDARHLFRLHARRK